MDKKQKEILKSVLKILAPQAPKNYQSYELLKYQVDGLNLSPKDYEKSIKKLCEVLNL